MTLQRAIIFGAILLVFLNLFGLLSADSIWLTRFSTIIITIILCLFIYFLDLKERSPNTYYELGFIYTLMSIVASMIFALFEEDLSFELILSSFAIALITSVFGMILKVLNEKTILDSSFEEYNKSLADLTTNIRIASDDVLKSSNKFADKLNEQADRFGDAIDQFQRNVSIEVNRINEAINKQETDFSEIKQSLHTTSDSVSMTNERIEQVSTAINGVTGEMKKSFTEGFTKIQSDSNLINSKTEQIRIEVAGINSQLIAIKEIVEDTNSNEEIKQLIVSEEKKLKLIISDLSSKVTEIKTSIETVDYNSINSSLDKSSEVLQQISGRLNSKDEKIVTTLNDLIKEIKLLKKASTQKISGNNNKKRSLMDIILFRK